VATILTIFQKSN